MSACIELYQTRNLVVCMSIDLWSGAAIRERQGCWWGHQHYKWQVNHIHWFNCKLMFIFFFVNCAYACIYNCFIWFDCISEWKMLEFYIFAVEVIANCSLNFGSCCHLSRHMHQNKKYNVNVLHDSLCWVVQKLETELNYFCDCCKLLSQLVSLQSHCGWQWLL